jgi:hypothetical protein
MPEIEATIAPNNARSAGAFRSPRKVRTLCRQRHSEKPALNTRAEYDDFQS